MNVSQNKIPFKTLLVTGCLLVSSCLLAQKPNIDSLKKVLSSQTESTLRLFTLNQLSDVFSKLYLWDSVDKYAGEQLSIAKKINSPVEIALAYRRVGHNEFCKNNYAEALRNLDISLKIYKQLNDTNGIAIVVMGLGNVNYALGNYSLALRNSLDALRTFQGSNKTRELANCNYSIALCYEVLHDYPQSLQYYFSTLRTLEKIKPADYWEGDNNNTISLTQCAIGNIYNLQGDYQSALEWLQLSLSTNVKTADSKMKNYNNAYLNNCMGEVLLKQGNTEMALQKQLAALQFWRNYDDLIFDSWAIPHTYKSIGDIYKRIGETALKKNSSKMAKTSLLKSIENYSTSLKESTLGNDKSIMPPAYLNTAKVYLLLKNEKLALENLHKGLDIAKRIGDKEFIKESFLCFFQLDSLHGDYKKALENYSQYIIYRDSLLGEDSKLKSESFRLQYEFEKKNDEIKALSSESKLHVLEAKQQKQQKNMAYAAMLFLFIAGSFSFYLFRKRKAAKNKQAMTAERLRISQELHDEVGATLSGIAMYTHLAKAQIKNAATAEIENSLNVIQSNSSEMVNKLNDIVWLINPGQDSLQQLLQRLEDYAVQMAAVKNIRVKSNVNGHFEGVLLPAETRRNVYLLFKEAINNAVKYSNATLLELMINKRHDIIEMSLRDNGDGFDAHSVKRGNGLNNMEQRAKDTSTYYLMESAKGTGTSITVMIKIP